ncbi:MAG: phosphoglucosamine mutase [Bacteroidales bacterium]|jgi:phosphomannomutase|nr:phosphoglucosamine mutase [Bacteroidales bacterium]
MTLIKSISGIRGTIGGRPGESLSPIDIVKFTAAYGTWLRKRNRRIASVVTGRDARQSGPMVSQLVIMTLRSLGLNVIDLGMATTPTVEIAVTGTGSSGGIIVTASHNPAEWNALKLLNEKGEFLSASDGEKVLAIAESEDFDFPESQKQGSLRHDKTWNKKHIRSVLGLSLADVKAIKKANFTVALDCINSVGGIIVPDLLKALGVNNITGVNMDPDGDFAHNPEPLPENLTGISRLVRKAKADVGFVVDPDVDRLAIVCEDGSMFGEEYTLVAVSDYILGHTPGNTVSNLSSTMALKDITMKHGCRYYSSAVGEVNVVAEMKKRKAVIGGEGNGGVIYPKLHYGRDALAGIALFLSHLAVSRMKCSRLRRKYPDYVISKTKVALRQGIDFNAILGDVRKEFRDSAFDERDGMKIELPQSWVQIRKSNTEPIIRIYSEAKTLHEAQDLALRVSTIVKKH